MKIVGTGLYLAYIAFLLYQANNYMEQGQTIPDDIWRPLGFLLVTGVFVVAVFVWVGAPPKGIVPRTSRSTVVGALLLLWACVAFMLAGM